MKQALPPNISAGSVCAETNFAWCLAISFHSFLFLTELGNIITSTFYIVAPNQTQMAKRQSCAEYCVLFIRRLTDNFNLNSKVYPANTSELCCGL